jgi:hypothetical protein
MIFTTAKDERANMSYHLQDSMATQWLKKIDKSYLYNYFAVAELVNVMFTSNFFNFLALFYKPGTNT